MASQKDLKLAREAGAAFRRADNSTLPDEAVVDPVAACPFPEGDEQRTAWLEGFVTAQEQDQGSVDAVRKALKEAKS